MPVSKSDRILYIQNRDTSTSSLLLQTLQQTDYIIDVASNNDEGQAMQRTTTYRLIIIDQQKAGLEIIRWLAESKSLIPTLIIVDSGDEKIAVEAIRSGATDYLVRDSGQNHLDLLPLVIEQVLRQQNLAEGKQQAEEQIEKTLRQVERAKQEWEATVDSLSQLICLLDDQGRIIRANRTIERWNLSQVVEVKGRKLTDMLRAVGLVSHVETDWPQAWQLVGQGQTASFEARDKEQDRYFLVQLRPLSQKTIWRYNTLTPYIVTIIHDITERKRAEEALRQHAFELQARNEELNAFAHTVAHDLQNPLGLIIGFATTLSKYHATMPPDDMRHNLENMAKIGFKMSNIIDELLLLASVRQQEVKWEPLDMGSIVAEAQQRLSDLIDEAQAQILLPESWPVSVGYAPWVEHIWINYLSNAIKYGGNPPRLELGAEQQPDGMVRFWIRDNGIGLSKKEQKQLFNLFTRLDQTRVKGHGLGLSIVRRIVTKLGGEVGVDSEGIPGQGSIFSFTLPYPANETSTD